MVNKKVNLAMIERWRDEINRRTYQTCKTNIIKEIAKREGLSHETINFWTMPEKYREKRRQCIKDYQKEHLEECRKRGREYAAENRNKQKEHQRVRYANPEINAHILVQKHLHWKVTRHIEQVLPVIIPAGNQPISIEEMIDTLQHITDGVSVRYSTIEKSIENYLAHNHRPLIKEVEPGEYIRT